MAPTLGSAQAQRVLAAAERAARGLGVAAFIVVVDDCADLKAASRQDGNSRASLTLAPLKAETSVAFRISTATLASRTTDPVRAQSLLAAGFTLLGGGVPLIVDSQVVGAIGVGGGSPDQDVQIAEAGAAALRS
ncbi:MAG: GlcG/HbpS family heme-binding protein [Ornithinibacter sp.]